MTNATSNMEHNVENEETYYMLGWYDIEYIFEGVIN